MCKKQELNLLIFHDDELHIEEVLEDESLEEEAVSELVSLSLNSLMGLDNPRTMKLRVLMAEREVIVMVDSGATHNFISQNLVQELGLSVDFRKFASIIGL